MRPLQWIAIPVLVLLLNAMPAAAQSVVPPQAPETPGGSTLEDILARQAAQDDGREARDIGSAADRAAEIGTVLGTRGGASDSDLWNALRFGTGDVKVSAGGPEAAVIIQDKGMWWQGVRTGPLLTYGLYLLLATVALLALFYLLRGRIRISGGLSGITILRFNGIERFAHWLLAGSFITLGLTGLITLGGRKGLIPLLGKDGFALLATGSKWLHNNVGWAFMIAVVMVFFLWVRHNLPSRTDITWFLGGGGIIGKAHPPAKKFNAGQKLIFWSVIILGGSISASGLSLLFPYELPMFAKTFAVLNDWGVHAWIGMEPFPAALTPHAEMQFAQLWHTIVAFVMMAIIIAHIYIGSIGMEGAYDAMGSGEVELNWAREHHSLWVEEVEARERAAGRSVPAE